MDTLLGLLGVAAYILAVLAFAAAITWLVVKISPDPQRKRRKQAEAEQGS